MNFCDNSLEDENLLQADDPLDDSPTPTSGLESSPATTTTLHTAGPKMNHPSRSRLPSQTPTSDPGGTPIDLKRHTEATVQMDTEEHQLAPTRSPSMLTSAQRCPIPKKLEHILSRKAYLHSTLHRAKHHLSYFDICENSDRVPLGLRIEGKFNPIELDSPSSTKIQIEHVLQRTDREIQDILVQHYRNILPELQEELERLENRLNNIQTHRNTTPSGRAMIERKLNYQKKMRTGY